jgi:hypothetical protein
LQDNPNTLTLQYSLQTSQKFHQKLNFPPFPPQNGLISPLRRPLQDFNHNLAFQCIDNEYYRSDKRDLERLFNNQLQRQLIEAGP